MTTLTHNLRMYVPDFDQIPWDTEVNGNWQILDATVGMFTAIPNLVGVWKNSTAYTFGQSVIDSVDSSIWECLQSHTSSASPILFSNERVTYPARWAQTTQSAQSYAAQAAASATAAAQAAADAQAAAATSANKLPLAGGTMTGFITLHSDPGTAMHPATKQYVDARVGATGFLPTTGGTLTGPLVVSHGITYNNMVVGERRGMAFGWNGSAVTAMVDGVGVSPLASQTFLSGNYIPISGGTITGNLTVNGQIATTSSLILTNSGAYFASDANYTYLRWDGGGWSLRYTRATGTLEHFNSVGTQLFAINPNGDVFARGGVVATGALVAQTGNAYVRGNSVFWGAADRSRLYSDNATVTEVQFLDSYRFRLAWGTGVLNYQNASNTTLLALDPGGSLAIIGNFTASGIVCAGGGSAAQFGNGGSGRYMQMSPNWYWDWTTGTGTMTWYTDGGPFWVMRKTDNLCFNNVGAVGATSFPIMSDERLKQDIAPLRYGLDVIKQINPITFTRVANNKHSVGFSAQNVQLVIPEAITRLGIELPDGSGGMDSDEPTLGVSTEPIIAALVNGMKEIASRLDALENK
jgi:hypothetical protein